MGAGIRRAPHCRHGATSSPVVTPTAAPHIEQSSYGQIQTPQPSPELMLLPSEVYGVAQMTPRPAKCGGAGEIAAFFSDPARTKRTPLGDKPFELGEPP